VKRVISQPTILQSIVNNVIIYMYKNYYAIGMYRKVIRLTFKVFLPAELKDNKEKIYYHKNKLYSQF